VGDIKRPPDFMTTNGRIAVDRTIAHLEKLGMEGKRKVDAESLRQPNSH
jgi:hypothetical protein